MTVAAPFVSVDSGYAYVSYLKGERLVVLILQWTMIDFAKYAIGCSSGLKPLLIWLLQ